MCTLENLARHLLEETQMEIQKLTAEIQKLKYETRRYRKHRR